MDKQKSIIIFGIGPISKTIFYDSKNNGKYTVCCFTADQQYIKADTLCGLPIIAFEEIEKQCPPDIFNMLVVNAGLGARFISRKDMFLRAKNKGYNLINYISSKADVQEDIQLIGQNNLIMANTHIGPNGTMGDNNFIRENIYIGHDFTLGNHNVLSAGCNFGGYCQIGDLNFIGMGTTVINDIKIMGSNLIGAGSLVIRSIESYGKYMGHPASKKGIISSGE